MVSENQADVIAEALSRQESIIAQVDSNRAEAKNLLNDKDKLEQFLERLEAKLTLIPVAGKYLSDIPVLISLIRAYVDRSYTQVPVGSIIAIIAALIYVATPTDALPDPIPVVGWLDDAGVLALTYTLVHDDIADYKRWRESSLTA